MTFLHGVDLSGLEAGLAEVQRTMAKTEETLRAKIQDAGTPETKAALQKLLRQIRRSPMRAPGGGR